MIHDEDLGPGGKGQLAVLTAEVRAMRNEIVALRDSAHLLAADAAALRSELAAIRYDQSRMLKLLEDALAGIDGIFALATSPADPAPPEDQPDTPSSNGDKPTPS